MLNTISQVRPHLGQYEAAALIHAGRPLRLWQAEALQNWERANNVGIVEAVTGSGKSLVGVIAAARALDAGMAVVIVVPKKVLQEQWIDDLRKYIRHPGIVGGLGGEYGTDFHCKALRPRAGKIVVAVVNTFAANLYLHPGTEINTLLIADEAHNYASPFFSQILNLNFVWRLGLTATVELQNGRYGVLSRYFGRSPIYSYTYQRAIDEGTVSQFDVLLLRVEMPDHKLREYLRWSEYAKHYRNRIIQQTGITFDADHVQREINALKEKQNCLQDIKGWEEAMDAVDEILIQTESKALAVKQVASLVFERGNTIVFSDSVARADQTRDIFAERGVRSEIIKASVRHNQRQIFLNQLKSKALKAIISPKALDEGVNIEALNIGIFVGVRRHRLQLIQRLGRVLRVEEGKQRPLIIIPVNKATWEDPYLQDNQRLKYSPLHLIVGLASEVYIEDAKDTAAISGLLAGFRTPWAA